MLRSRIASICGSLLKTHNLANVSKQSNVSTFATPVYNTPAITKFSTVQNGFSYSLSSGSQSTPIRRFHTLKPITGFNLANSLLNAYTSPTQTVPSRNVVVFGFRGKRKRKTVKAVVQRFYRLQWGAWIRPRSGRHRKLYKKAPTLRRWLRYHVFCNASQSLKLDKMVGKCWRTRKYYVDDPYELYHTRLEHPQFNRRGLDRNDRPFI